MAYVTTANCIGCERCIPACPTAAIRRDGAQARISESLCNSCVGSFGVPQCWASCPTSHGCIEAIAASATDYWENWFATYTRVVGRLNQSTSPKYWNRWFDRYAAVLKRLQGDRSVTS